MTLLEKLSNKRNGVTFKECLFECASIKEFVLNFDRLHNTNLSLNGSPLSLEIDKVSGRLDNNIQQFIGFCWEYVFLRF